MVEVAEKIPLTSENPRLKPRLESGKPESRLHRRQPQHHFYRLEKGISRPQHQQGNPHPHQLTLRQQRVRQIVARSNVEAGHVTRTIQTFVRLAIQIVFWQRAAWMAICSVDVLALSSAGLVLFKVVRSKAGLANVKIESTVIIAFAQHPEILANGAKTENIFWITNASTRVSRQT